MLSKYDKFNPSLFFSSIIRDMTLKYEANNKTDSIKASLENEGKKYYLNKYSLSCRTYKIIMHKINRRIHNKK